MLRVVYKPHFNDSPTNPARCFYKEGIIEINRSAFDLLTPYQQKFVLQHEVGHYVNQNRDEIEADRYALNQLALKEPNSLYNYAKSVERIAKQPLRIQQAKIDVLKKAAENGSEYARSLLLANADGSENKSRKYNLMILIIVITLVIVLIWKMSKK